jgi:hypothetical protein
MKSHTQGIMSLGKGTEYGTSACQNVNAKSSTERACDADNVPQMS